MTWLYLHPNAFPGPINLSFNLVIREGDGRSMTILKPELDIEEPASFQFHALDRIHWEIPFEHLRSSA